MNVLTMSLYWKAFLLLTSTHYAQSFNRNWIKTEKSHPHKAFIESIYDPGTSDIPDYDDVHLDYDDAGEPLILTPYIENNYIIDAKLAARNVELDRIYGVTSYSGYLTVDKINNGNLFFWYFPAASRPADEAPLIIWLQGGPGASSLYGLFVEIGPYTVLENGTLKDNKYTWGKNYSLLFIDNPVGTGFSFTNDDGYTTNQTTIGEHLYIALQQFLTVFDELRAVPLFIAGESYAGKHIPSLAIQIHRNRDQEPINLQGLAIGNGFIDPITLLRYSYFTREVGLVDDKTADKIKQLETQARNTIEAGDSYTAFWEFGRILDIIELKGRVSNIYNYLTERSDLFGEYAQFVQNPLTRRDLHVGNTPFSGVHNVYHHLIPDFMNSAKPWLEELLDHYRVLLYSGHLDCIVPYHASVNTHKSLKYSGAKKYKRAERFPWFHNNRLAGYYKKGGNLLEVMVRGAGHIVPMDKPAEALALITAFIEDIPLERYN